MRNNICALALITFLSLCFFCFVSFSIHLLAVQAYPDWVTIKQPDGNEIEIKVKGDERIHWYQSREGYTLLVDSAGYFVYATQDAAGDLVPSEHRYYNADVKIKTAPGHYDFLKSLPKNLFYSSKQVNDACANWSSYNEVKSKPGDKLQQYNPVKIEGTRKFLVVLMSYPDKQFANSREDFEALFNATNYSGNGNEGSVKDYFVENSFGNFAPEFVVVGPFVARHPMAYYEYNRYNWPTSNVRKLIEEAIVFADEEVDFADFDNDNDGYVDAVTVVYAGAGAEIGTQDAIWPHASILGDYTIQHDGKYVSRYCCSAEARNRYDGMARIGTFCHEFCHTLGSPDYYDTDYGEQGDYPGLGSWCLMSAGNYNGSGGCPAPINSFQKWMFGWIEPQVLPNTTGVVSNMPPTATNPIAYRINTDIADEFFLLENRQRVGFDKYIEGSGMLIWHVHSTLAERLNNGNGQNINVTHPQLFYPVCASSTIAQPYGEGSYGWINDDGCVFPGSSNKTFFTNNSTPAAISWSKNMATSLINIQEIDTFVSFNYNIYTIPYSYNFTDVNHYQIYQQDNSTLPAVAWNRTDVSDNWLMRLRGTFSLDKTPHEHYLFLPAFYLEKDMIYHLRFNARVYSSDYPGNARIYLCSSNNINDEKVLLHDFSELASTTFQENEHDFAVGVDGIYYIAIASITRGDVMDLYFDDINISQTVGIEEKETTEELQINCYPNPANNYIFIDNYSDEHIEKVDIVDINGRVVINNMYSNSNSPAPIDISGLLSGNYYVLIHTTEGNKKLIKLIKN